MLGESHLGHLRACSCGLVEAVFRLPAGFWFSSLVITACVERIFSEDIMGVAIGYLFERFCFSFFLFYFRRLIKKRSCA